MPCKRHMEYSEHNSHRSADTQNQNEQQIRNQAHIKSAEKRRFKRMQKTIQIV